MRTTHYQCDGLRSKRTLEHSSSPPSSTKNLESLINRAFQGFSLPKINRFYTIFKHLSKQKSIKKYYKISFNCVRFCVRFFTIKQFSLPHNKLKCDRLLFYGLISLPFVAFFCKYNNGITVNVNKLYFNANLYILH